MQKMPDRNTIETKGKSYFMKKWKLQILALSLLGAGILLTVFSGEASAYTLDGLLICAEKVVPSLFPYMVVSSLFVYSGLAAKLGRRIPAAAIFGLPGEASSSLILGALCGFPVGAKTAVDLYKSGCVSKTEAEVLISVSNNTGPSFVVGIVGAIFWGSPAFGWAIYFFQILASIAAGLLVNRLVFPFKSSCLSGKASHQSAPFSLLFSTAVSEAALSCLSISGFVVFFYVIIRFITDALAAPLLPALLAACLEFTTGTAQGAGLGGFPGAFLCGFSVGWSGLSVFFQACSFALPAGLSLKRTAAVKSLQGIFTGILCMLYMAFFPVSPPTVSVSAFFTEYTAGTALIIFFLLFFLFFMLKPRKKL